MQGRRGGAADRTGQGRQGRQSLAKQTGQGRQGRARGGRDDHHCDCALIIVNTFVLFLFSFFFFSLLLLLYYKHYASLEPYIFVVLYFMLFYVITSYCE